MNTQDEIYYLTLILDQIYGLNESIKEYFNYLVLKLEEIEEEEQLQRQFRKIPF